MANDELRNADSEDFEYWLLAVEKSFHITLERDFLDDVQTFGDLTDRITGKLTLVHTDDCTTQQAFYKLRVAMTDILEVDGISPNTLLADILPRRGRIRNTERLERELGFQLNLLQPPDFVLLGLFVLLVASVLGLPDLLATSFSGFRINFRISILGLLISIVGLILSFRWGKELSVKTVGELARQVAQEQYVLIRRDPSRFNRNEIEPLLADWLSRYFALSRSKLTRDSRFEWTASTSV